jgi:hypothetical protein
VSNSKHEPARNVTVRVPSEWRSVIVSAAEASGAENFGQWGARAWMRQACAELGLPELELVETPSRDEIRAVAQTLGLSEDQLKARALTELVRSLKSEPPPAPVARPKSGEYAIPGNLTPSQGFHALRAARGGK